MKAKQAEDLPTGALLSDIEAFRVKIHQTLAAYEANLNEQLTTLTAAIETKLVDTKERSGQLRDLRDMLTVLRSLEIKPDKGRRKDLKKIDSLVGDLSMLVEHWE